MRSMSWRKVQPAGQGGLADEASDLADGAEELAEEGESVLDALDD